MANLLVSTVTTYLVIISFATTPLDLKHKFMLDLKLKKKMYHSDVKNWKNTVIYLKNVRCVSVPIKA